MDVIDVQHLFYDNPLNTVDALLRWINSILWLNLCDFEERCSTNSSWVRLSFKDFDTRYLGYRNWLHSRSGNRTSSTVYAWNCPIHTWQYQKQSDRDMKSYPPNLRHNLFINDDVMQMQMHGCDVLFHIQDLFTMIFFFVISSMWVMKIESYIHTDSEVRYVFFLMRS